MSTVSIATSPATVREHAHIVVAPRPVRRWYVQPVACWDAWALGAGWSACIACHLDGQPVLLPDGREVEFA